MSEHTTSTAPLIEIAARIPGPWRSLDEVRRRLPRDCRMIRNQLQLPDGRRFGLSCARADREFPAVFQTACRRDGRPDQEQRLRHYRMNVELVAAGGSAAHSQHMMEAAAVLLRAGGFGVFIDNGLVAHWKPEWMELVQHRDDPQARLYAFVNMVNGGHEFFSSGMHVLGERDGVITVTDHAADCLASLEDFVRMSSDTHPPLVDGATFFDEQGQRFELRGETHQMAFPNHPATNPFGRWRLRPSQKPFLGT